MSHFLVYKITNLINDKIYIGQHLTKNKNDSYMGSGTAIKAAVKKYGKHNFKKEILSECSSFEEMDIKEAEIVDIEFISREDNYNLRTGGKQGSIRKLSEETKNKISESLSGENNPFYGKTHSDESKIKMSKAKSGKIHLEKTKTKISESQIGRIFSEEHLSKISKSLKGRTLSAEHRAKMSASRRGKTRGPYNKQKVCPIL